MSSPCALPPLPARANAKALGVGLGWALLYLLLATPRLAHQGLYYDEIHQAPAAFAFIPPANWSATYSIRGVPMLNTPYGGAIKSAMYGAWLRLSARPFTVASWRWLGCLLGAIGILLACASFARSTSMAGASLLGLLVATDVTVLLATRHDWGPVALALLLRLALLAVWVRAWGREQAGMGESLALGFLLGVALFEKLSSVVLLIPVAAAFLLDARRRNSRNLVAGVLGGLVGSLPLIVVNLHSWLTTHSLVSLSSDAWQSQPLPPLSDFLVGYGGLGAGAVLVEWILGEVAPEWVTRAEGLVVLFLCLTLVAASLTARPIWRMTRAAGVFALLYPVVGLAVVALPAGTWVHHWVIGTPFQYVAFAFAASALVAGEGRGTLPGWILAWAFAPALVVLLLLRAPSVIALEGLLRAGLSSAAFDPSLTRLAEFAARQPRDTVFVAGEWGVANQILCVSNGRIPVPEPYWAYRDGRDLLAVVEGAPRFYLLGWRPIADQPGQARRMLADARILAGFREVPVEPEIAGWRAVQAWKFVRVGPE